MHDLLAVIERNSLPFTLTKISIVTYDTSQHRYICTDGEDTILKTELQRVPATQLQSKSQRESKIGNMVDRPDGKYSKYCYSLSEFI